MPVRLVEGKLPYTGGDAITVDENKVISLNLRDENNLIIYDAQDDEIYVDLQLPEGIKPTDAFPVGVTTGRVLVADGWDKAGTIISAKTTSGDVIKLLYADDGTLWIDNGTGTFKQIYFKADVDAIITTLTSYINAELAKKQNGVVSATAPESPAQGDLWYDTTSNSMKVYDGTNWNAVGTGGGGSDIEYVTQAEYEALLPGALTDNKHYFIYEEEVGPTPPTPPFTPGANTIAYYPFDTDWDDYSGNGYNITTTGTSSIGTNQGVDCLSINNSALQASTIDSMASYSEYTWLFYAYRVSDWYEIQFADGGAWGGNGPSFRVSSNEMRWGNGTDTYTSFSNSYSPMNTWFFFALVVRSGNGIIYCNNNSTTIKTGVLAPSANAAPLRIGAVNGGNCYGYLSKLILEKRAWTDQEIIDYFNATKGDYGIS